MRAWRRLSAAARGGRWIGWLSAAAVLIVAGIAAVVSYIHIQTLAVTHGQDQLAAALLPLSVDGTVAAASLQMLRAARAGRKADWLQQVMLWLGVAATLAANVLYGLPGGAVAAVISGWPALAFLGSAEMAIRSVHLAGPAAARKSARSRPPAREHVRTPGRQGGGGRARGDHRIEDRAAAILAARPDIKGSELGPLVGRSARHGRRLLRQLAARPEGRAA